TTYSTGKITSTELGSSSKLHETNSNVKNINKIETFFMLKFILYIIDALLFKRLRSKLKNHAFRRDFLI
ncbi:MAG: hypothetical protein ABNG98_08430, partial [Flavobacterium sp.]